ncbi:MAG: hypothetical protein WC533_03680 [Candidatus Pacearchaeota archaeon]
MNYKKILIITLLVLILFGIVIRVASIGKDFSAEETDFVKPAIAIAETGKPVFYLSEQNPVQLALWHPPMYIYLMSMIFKFGINEVNARSINILFSLLTAVLIYLLCSKLIKEEKGKLIGLIAGTFFLTNYYIFSSSILIDIDMLSAFFCFAFVSCILMHQKSGSKIYVYLSSLSLFFAMFNRWIIAGIIYFFIGIYYLYNKELRKNFKSYLLTGIASLIAFLSIWGLYITINSPGNYLFFIKHNAGMGIEQISNFVVYLGSFMLNISQLIRLVTLPALILCIWAIVSLFKWESKSVKVILIYVISTAIFFLVLPRPAFGYPRYFLTVFPGIAVLIGLFLYKNMKDIEINKRILVIFASSFIASLLLLVVLSPQLTIYSSKGLIMATNLPDFIFNIFASLPLLFVLFFNKEEKRKTLLIILIALILSYTLFFTIGLTLDKTYTKEAGQYIREFTNESDVVIVPKAVGYYTDRKFYFNDNHKPYLDFSLSNLKMYFVKSYESRFMEDEFFWEKGFYSGLYPPLPEENALKQAKYIVLYHPVAGYEYEIKIGDFYIYKNL